MFWTTASLKISQLQKRVRVVQGGTCFAGEQLVVTQRGSIPIKYILQNDFVLSYNEEIKSEEWKLVNNVFKHNNTKPTVKIKLKNGKEIICTDDHRFYYKGGWTKVKCLLSLLDGNMEKNTKI
jgi:hypothetical protein